MSEQKKVKGSLTEAAKAGKATEPKNRTNIKPPKRGQGGKSK